MKKVSLILAALIFISISSFASGPEGMEERRSLKEQVFEKVDMSKYDTEGSVIVRFEVSDENTIIIQSISTDNPELERYVINCLNDSSIAVSDQMKNKVFEIELNFYLL